jgi:Zn-dependent membrane protease YugP
VALFAFLPLIWDPTFILLIPAMILALWAQARVRGAYKKYLRVPSRAGLPGHAVAQRILAKHGLGEVEVQVTRGELDDHYDPRRRSVNLSPAVAQQASLASLAIAAHETGHAMQHGEDWFPLVLRGRIAPVVGIGSTLAFPLFLIGFIFSSFKVLMDVGILFFSGAVLFHMITLPVEFDASKRALAILQNDGYLAVDEIEGARKVLNAAALTYVAAAAVSVMHLIRLLVLRGARD